MTNVLIKGGKTQVLETVLIADDVDVYTIPRRSYDYSKGDRRFFDYSRAVEHANDEARSTGVRQCIRPDVAEVPGQRHRLWLVQAIGS
jgi:hypothetical protein